jgi:hypothetical protein
MNYEDILKDTIKFEMDGKNQAIHEYDKMIWALRTGFLTVFFAVWGLIIKAIIDKGEMPLLNNVVPVMIMLAAVISLSACCIDSSYVRRKYKVIAALNKLYRILIDYAQGGTIEFEKFKEVLKISGTTVSSSGVDTSTTAFSTEADKKSDILKGTGYWREIVVCVTVYLVPMIALIAGIIMLGK